MGSVQRNRRERTSEKIKQGRMTKPIILLSALAVVLSVFLPALDAASVRRRSRNQSVSARNRLASARNSRRASVRSFRARNNKLRRGRQEEEELADYEYVDVPLDYDLAGDASEAVDYEVAAEASDAVESSDIPTWCDPSQNLAAFLLFPKLKCWCVDNGYGPEFGPYGSGCPADDVDNALDAGASETVEEEVSLEDVLAEEGVDYDYVDDIEAAVAESEGGGEEARREEEARNEEGAQRKGKSQRRVKSQKNGRS